MDNRLIAVAALVLVAGTAGCSSKEPALGGTTAKVTINGKSTGGAHDVICTQTGWMWNIETPDQSKGFKATLDTGDKVVVQTIKFNGIGGFTGNFWRDNIGDAQVSGTGGKFTITGSADGSFAENPSNAVTATFRIEAHC